MNYEQQYAEYMQRCENALKEVSRRHFQADSEVSAAAEYSLFNGGKRVRGVLVLAVCDLLSGDTHTAEVLAAAVEMIHSFSLVHDDLPCMDDDDFRRGKPSTHVVYGQANALLAGDLLAIEAFHAIAAADIPAKLGIEAVRVLSAGSAAKGMIYGQELDLANEHQAVEEEVLAEIQHYKTGALLRASAGLGVCSAGFREEDCPEILRYADLIGRTFQIIDDILDETSTSETLGKPVGSDKSQGKNTYVTILGIDDSRALAQRLTQEAIDLLWNKYDIKSSFLTEMAERLVHRIS